MPNTPGVVIGKRSVVTHEPTPGGGHRVRVKDVPVLAPKVQVVHPSPQHGVFSRVTGGATKAVTAGPTRLGTPVALLMLGGLLLVYYALHGWDRKYGTFGGTFSGKGAIPPSAVPSTPGSTSTSSQQLVGPSAPPIKQPPTSQQS